jgi:hypothetical protein
VPHGLWDVTNNMHDWFFAAMLFDAMVAC